MGRTLKRTVILGENVYVAGTDEAKMGDDAKLVTNPRAWGEEDEDAVQAAVSPGPTPTGPIAGINGDTTPGDTTPDGSQPAPPRSGPGSGEKAWQEWASTRSDLDVAPDAKKADIIAAAENAGLIERQQ